MKNATSGRLVWNHSTHVPGLISLLDCLRQQDGVGTITPGVIRSTRSHVPHLTLKVSVPIQGGFKLIARRGKTVQEVFVLTSLTQTELEAAIADLK